MKNKGFTLIELIAVIAILALIALVVYPAINSVIKNARENTYLDQIDVIIKAAKEWSIDNASKLPDDAEYNLPVKTLIDEGYITNDEVKNPRNSKENLDGDIIIKYNEEIKSFEYSYSDEEVNVTMNTSQIIYQNSKKKLS